MLDEERRSYLINLVRDVSRAEILPRFRRLDASKIEIKSGPADLVTIADRRTEAAISAALKRDWPEASVIGEEAVSENPKLLDQIQTSEWTVVLDPVDGTWNYARGLAVFGVIVAVLHHGRTVWGALYDPLLDDWVEVGEDTRFVTADGCNRVMRCSSEGRLDHMTGYVPLFLFEAEHRAKLGATFASFGRVQSLRCACHEYRMLVQGHVDFKLTRGLNPWDHLAGALAVQKAGGVVRLLDGRDYLPEHRNGPLLVAGSETAWENACQVFSFLIEPYASNCTVAFPAVISPVARSNRR